jgi:phosphohistidine phosphatase
VGPTGVPAEARRLPLIPGPADSGTLFPMATNSNRRLVLLRHAKSAWPDVADHERPLARRGQRDAPEAGRWLRQAGYLPDLVLCSTAQRARETWRLAAAGLASAPVVRFEPQVYQADADDLLDLVRQTPPEVRTLLVVGHEPTMRALTLLLAAAVDGSDPGPLERVRLKFPTAATAVLAFTAGWPELGQGRAELMDFAVPADYGA